MALETLDPQSSPDVAEPALPVGKAAVATGPYALPTGGVATGVDESLLENMRKLIADREAQKNSFGESLRDAQAWWSGGDDLVNGAGADIPADSGKPFV